MARYCRKCGSAVKPSDAFCANCGHSLTDESPAAASTPFAAERPETVAADLRYRLSPTRVLFMTVITYGLYLFYWFYLTWKQYRDSNGEQTFYPVWHALTLLVPVYGLFRTHAHMRVYRDAMVSSGLVTTISAGWAVVALIFSNVSVSYQFFSDGITQREAVVTALVDTVAIVILVWLLLHVQRNINPYWRHRSENRLMDAKIGVGEVVLVAIGALAWLDTFGNVFSEGYRTL